LSSKDFTCSLDVWSFSSALPLEYVSASPRPSTNGSGRRGLDGPASSDEINVKQKDDLAMKTRTSRIGLVLSVGAVSLTTLAAVAQSSASDAASTAAPTSAASESTSVKLPYGADEVLKLSRAQVGEDVTLNYIQNSGTIYNLSPKDIVYLKSEGVSDRVINAMMDQRKNVPAAAAAEAALQAQASVPVGSIAPSPDASSASAATPVYAPAPVYVQPVPVPVPVQSEPDYVPPSTLYIIPYSSSGSVWYSYPSAYFGRSYGCGSTFVTINTGYGGGRCYSTAYRGGSGRSFHSFGRRH
jgi:hypothetical protein